MEFFLSSLIKIAILLNPFAVLSTFIALTSDKSVRERKIITFQTCITVIIAGIIVLFSGHTLMSLLGLELAQFKVGGGVILMVCSISLVWGNSSNSSYQKDATDNSSISVVPLAIPMALGPGTAAGLIIIGSEIPISVTSVFANILALIGGVIVLAVVLSLGINAERVLNRSAIAIITKLTGLLLSGIAAGMILEGVQFYLKSY